MLRRGSCVFTTFQLRSDNYNVRPRVVSCCLSYLQSVSLLPTQPSRVVPLVSSVTVPGWIPLSGLSTEGYALHLAAVRGSTGLTPRPSHNSPHPMFISIDELRLGKKLHVHEQGVQF